MLKRVSACVILAALVAAPVSSQASRHCDNEGVAPGHDCDEATPTPTPTATPTPIPQTGGVWKDATGAVVPGIRVLTLFNGSVVLGLVYKDPLGYLWHVDPWSLAVSTVDLGQIPSIFRFYTSSNCTGTYYFSPQEQQLIPRIVFRMDGDPTYRAFPDNPTLTTLTAHSYDGGVGSACQTPYTFTLTLIPGAQTIPATPITVPTVPFTGPIHLE